VAAVSVVVIDDVVCCRATSAPPKEWNGTIQRFGLKIGWTPPACYCQLLAMSGIGFAFGFGKWQPLFWTS